MKLVHNAQQCPFVLLQLPGLVRKLFFLLSELLCLFCCTIGVGLVLVPFPPQRPDTLVGSINLAVGLLPDILNFNTQSFNLRLLLCIGCSKLLQLRLFCSCASRSLGGPSRRRTSI